MPCFFDDAITVMPKRERLVKNEEIKPPTTNQPIVIIPNDPFGLWNISKTITVEQPVVASARKSIVIQAELERLREMSNREAKTVHLVEDLSLGFSKSAYILEEEKEMAKLLS